MWSICFKVHSDNDTEESSKFWHSNDRYYNRLWNSDTVQFVISKNSATSSKFQIDDLLNY